jgi:hypothetical protein
VGFPTSDTARITRPLGRVTLAGWYRSHAVAVALGHRAERLLIIIVHCQYAPRAGCLALRPERHFSDALARGFVARASARLRVLVIGRLGLIPPVRLCFGPLIAGGCQVRSNCPCRGPDPFQGLCLMNVFGSGASRCGAKCEDLAFSRITEVTITAVPARTTTGSADATGRIRVFLRRSLFISPFEACPVRPDAMQDDGNLARNCNLGLLGADPLHQSNAPGF